MLLIQLESVSINGLMLSFLKARLFYLHLVQALPASLISTQRSCLFLYVSSIRLAVRLWASALLRFTFEPSIYAFN